MVKRNKSDHGLIFSMMHVKQHAMISGHLFWVSIIYVLCSCDSGPPEKMTIKVEILIIGMKSVKILA